MSLEKLAQAGFEFTPEAFEASRYMATVRDGKPSIGPDTLTEHVKKLIWAQAYVDSFDLILYGTAGPRPPIDDPLREEWVNKVKETNEIRHM